MIRLRGHHLFCTTLFQGCGYDETFTVRMKETLAALEAGTFFTLCQGSDVLCGACPHRTGEGCALGTEDVLRRDEAALNAVGLTPGEELSFAQAGERLKKLRRSSGFLSAAAAVGKKRDFAPGNCFKSICKNGLVNILEMQADSGKNLILPVLFLKSSCFQKRIILK